MPRVIIPLSVFAVLAAMLSGCAASPAPPAKPPPVDPQTRLSPPKEEAPVPTIIAPPPAYGNKIVMARAGQIDRL